MADLKILHSHWSLAQVITEQGMNFKMVVKSVTYLLMTNLSTSDCFDKLVTAAMYFIIIFDASVFPAPLSPK